ncbi:MAG: hypothetical protein ACTHMR_03810, partial [Thermomicrobiales bacterium]
MGHGSDEAAQARQLYEAGKAGMAERFDPERGLMRAETEVGVFHPTRESLSYARCLLHDSAEAGDADSALGAAIVERVLAVQERQPGNIHEGNFPWMANDGYVADLNAVEFELEHLCAIMLESAQKLPPATCAAVRAAMRLGLAEIARLDVGVEYTNICLLDCHNSILGGQILGEPGWTERGARKLARWAAYTAQSGAPREYNSPTYAGVDLQALGAIAAHAADPATRLLALVLEERLWLHAATHYHAPTAQQAGPHSRAYQNDVTGGRGSLKTIYYIQLGDDALMRKSPFYALRQKDGNVNVGLGEFYCPAPIRAILTDKRWPFTVRETADAASDLHLSTTMTADWALGVASRSYGPQADNLILHYRKTSDPLPMQAPQPENVLLHYSKEQAPGFGVVYTRFILNNKRLGGSYHATDRTSSNNISDVGVFRGLHYRNKAIGVYGLAPQHEDVSSIKLDVFFPGRAGIEEALVDGQPITELPVEMPPGTPLVIADGAVYIGVLPLRHSNLGREAPVRLEESGGDLVLSTVIYEGPAKRFWEYSSLGGPFYKGNIECGLVLEVASRDQYPDAAAFAADLAAATITDTSSDGVRTICYRAGGDDLLLRYRLTDMEVLEQRVNSEPLTPLPLDAPVAVQRQASPLVLHGARLDAPVEPAANWLYTDPANTVLIATRATATSGPWMLALPDGRTIEAAALGLARVQCALAAEGDVAIECAGPPTTLTLRGWRERPSVTLNGAAASDRLHEDRSGGWQVLLAEADGPPGPPILGGA